MNCINQSTHPSFNHIIQSINRINQSINHINQSIHQSINPSITSINPSAIQSHHSIHQSHQSIEPLTNQQTNLSFARAALFQLLSLILFIQSSSDIHFCFNDKSSLVPNPIPPVLQMHYGTGFYVAILIFLLTNMAAVAASGRRCEDVVMAFKI